MKQKYVLVIVCILTLISINLVLIKNVFACVCPPLPICNAYSLSKAVFVGKVVKNEADEDTAFIRITFEVEKRYKGTLEKVKTARFRNSTCQTEFKPDEKYFVYELDFGYGCNPSAPFSQAVSDIKYAESLSESEPVFNISAFFNELSPFDAERMQVTIEKAETKYKPKINEYGSFDFTTKEKGTYKIKILFNYPLQLSLNRSDIILPNKAKYSITSTQTFLEYDAEFQSNGCDVREFYVSDRIK